MASQLDALPVPAHLPRLALDDDPFEDGDDPDFRKYHFSAGVVRQDMHKLSLAAADNGWADPDAVDLQHTAVKGPRHGFFHSDDNSVSTLDMYAEPEAHSSPSASSSRPHSPLDSPSSQHEPEFTQISLATPAPWSPSEEHNLDPPEQAPPTVQVEPVPEQPEADAVIEETEIPSSQNDSLDVFYSHVLIDASKSPSHRVTHSADYIASDNLSIPPPYNSDLTAIPSSPRSQSLPSTPTVPENRDAPQPVLSPSDVPPSQSTSVPNSPNGQPLTDITETKPSNHRPIKSVGPSALEKYISRTRPSFLPPKSRAEDDKHLADWESMMKHSRLAGTFLLPSLSSTI
jgi:TBC1 domain family member 14